MTDHMRERIASIMYTDLAEQLKACGFDDDRWAADVCDNTATAILGLFTPEHRKLDGQWISRLNSDWTSCG